MRRQTQGLFGLSLLVGAWAGPLQKKWEYKPVRHPDYPPDVVDQLLDETMPKVEAWMAKRAGQTNNCTLENALVRREWTDLSVAEREDYIAAVLCLQKLPPKAPRDQVPGALSRFDDFVATHMTMAPMLHSPANLFAGHRYFIHAYEKALREECGYKGAQPEVAPQYMNYDRYIEDPHNSALFNGNSSSMSGDGLKDPYPGIHAMFPKPYDIIPPGDGGGCVTTGPFKE
ncbi:hypothetical protein VTK26DRAFT_2924 [Humicola hyalothermophila]